MASHLTIKYTSRELLRLSIPTDAMGSRRGIAYAVLALILIASIQGSEFSRDESQEDQRTEFNLASTQPSPSPNHSIEASEERPIVFPSSSKYIRSPSQEEVPSTPIDVRRR